MFSLRLMYFSNHLQTVIYLRKMLYFSYERKAANDKAQ